MNDDFIIPTVGDSDRICTQHFPCGPRIFKMLRAEPHEENGKKGIKIFLKGEDLPYIPCLTVRRKLSHCGIVKATDVPGVHVRLYVEPDVHFGKEKVGGVRLSAISSINEKIEVYLQDRQKKKRRWIIQPLKIEEQDIEEEKKIDWALDIDRCASVVDLRSLWSKMPSDAKENFRSLFTAKKEDIES